MATETTNFGLTKDVNTDYYSIDTVNDNLDKIDKALGNVAKFETAGGNGTAITLNGLELVDGHSKTFVVSANNNGAATTINGKHLYKPGTTQAPKLIAGKAVTVWYNGNHFFIKASAEGDAIAENVLAGKIFSSDEDAGINGTMQDNGPSTAEIIDIATEGEEYIIPKGFHSGLRKIRAKISGLVASVIKSGVKVGGVTGTFTDDATAVDGDVLATKTYYRKGVKGTGSMVDRGTVNHTLPINGSYTIPSGKHSGTGKVTQDIPTQAAQTITPGTANQTIPSGRYLSGVQTILGDPDLISSNILKDKDIFGVVGNVVAGKRFASGTVTPATGAVSMRYLGKTETHGQSHYVVVSGLTFKPKVLLLFANATGTNSNYTVYLSDSDQTNSETGFLLSIYTSYYSSPSNQSVYSFNPNSGDVYVNSTGFKLPVGSSSPVYWFAWE